MDVASIDGKIPGFALAVEILTTDKQNGSCAHKVGSPTMLHVIHAAVPHMSSAALERRSASRRSFAVIDHHQRRGEVVSHGCQKRHRTVIHNWCLTVDAGQSKCQTRFAHSRRHPRSEPTRTPLRSVPSTLLSCLRDQSAAPDGRGTDENRHHALHWSEMVRPRTPSRCPRIPLHPLNGL